LQAILSTKAQKTPGKFRLRLPCLTTHFLWKTYPSEATICGKHRFGYATLTWKPYVSNCAEP
jgi:hypothetical protein